MDLTIIVLSYNTKDITDECLSRLQFSVHRLQKVGKKAEVIVVDNASTDGSVEMIEEKYSFVKFIKSSTNTGFSGGNNLAMKQARGKFILLLNSDAFIEEDTLEKSLEYFDKNSQADGIGVQQRFGDGRFQPSGGYLPNPLNTILWISGLQLLPGMEQLVPAIHPKSREFFKAEKQVDWVMGAYFFIKKEIFEKTGGFDEKIFAYGEEVEWCQRIKDTGFKIWYVPSIKITHLDKASSKFMLEKPLLNEIKGIVRFFHQHYPKSWWYVKIIMIKFLLLRAIIFGIMLKPQRAKAYWQALKVL